MLCLLMILYLTISYSTANDVLEEQMSMFSEENEHSFLPPDNLDDAQNKNIENAIERMENIAAIAEKSRREGVLPTDHTEELHNQMIETLDDITDQIKDPQKTYKFLNSKGVDRIITPIIGINYEPLKKQLLILIKTLFNVAPTTTNALIPISIVDKLLDIFENDDNLALKAHALDIMHIWLPNNPKIQARVMKLKGLEPFYQQVSKLDNGVIHTLLDLFNKILEEHLKARDNKSQRNKEDYEKMRLYQMIGLIERMSTPQVCNGVFNILEALLINDDKEVSASIFILVKNIKPFCSKLYKGKGRAVKLFDAIKKYVTDPNKVNIIETLGLNATEVQLVVEDFAKGVKENVRDEF